MKLRSYAKLNLTLDILKKRPDNYHELNTLFQHINLYDEIEFLPDKDISLSCNIKKLENKNNLVYKAATLLRKKFKIDKGININLKKNIPMGAGLSGGSSNAATTLKGLNIFWNLNLSKQELIDLSKEIGMDVAFHIIGGTCQGFGRGEKIVKKPNFDLYHIVLVYPDIEISSSEAYSSLDYSKIGNKLSTDNFMKNYDLQYLHNDFEYTIFNKYPELEKIKNQLGKNSLLSGSGSCVFGLFRNGIKAKEIYDKLKKIYNKTYLTTTLNKTIKSANEMGFCFGVKRAIEKITELSHKKNIYVLGKLIHNPQVIEKLKEKGIMMINDYKKLKEGTVVISAHGVSDKIINEIKDSNLDIIDLTCPLVEKLHKITKNEENNGRKIILYGDKEHTEVKGIIGNLKNYKVIKDINELTNKDLNSKITLVSQTTRDIHKFEKLSIDIKIIVKDIIIKDTICSATKNRQKSAIDLAKKSDIMIVIGGRMSSNTLRLKEICSRFCETIHIETEKELKADWFSDKLGIGITAGASTADYTIDAVKKRIEFLI